MRRLKSYLISAAIALALPFFTLPAAAQCAMCRASLAGSNNAAFIRSLNLGVLVLLIPPVAIFCSIFVVLKRRDPESREEKGSEADRE